MGAEDFINGRDLLDVEMSPSLREARKAMLVFRDRMKELGIQYIVKVCDEEPDDTAQKTALNVLLDSSAMSISAALVFLQQEHDWLQQKLEEKFGRGDEE